MRRFTGRKAHLHTCVHRSPASEVYLSTLLTSSGVSREVALKFFTHHLRPRSLELEQVRQEVGHWARVRHAALVSVEDLLILGDEVALLTDAHDGVDLSTIIAKLGPQPLAPVLSLLTLLADALDACWNDRGRSGEPHRWAHGQLRARQILVGPHGRVAFTSFGVHPPGGRSLDLRHPAWPTLAPELAMRRTTDEPPAPHISSDIYALGCIIVEALSGAPVQEAGWVASLPSEADHRAVVEAALDRMPRGAARLRDLLSSMLSFQPAGRPAPNQVRQAARSLRAGVTGPGLAAWSERVVADIGPRTIPDARFTGVTLFEEPFAEWLAGGLSPSPPSTLHA
ncbi:MAG: hypothetical protein EA397_17685 [Deltaproteobacteria bacterium]|nr:MAG: hypothetical protein EA397_17685 [Deltaproteobacteria bacterium]